MVRACLVREHYVPQDSRVDRELRALAGSGYRVDVICLRADGQPWRERRAGGTVYRLPLRHSRGRGRLRYVAEYATFFVLAGALLTALHARRRYRLVQVNSLPDALVFAAAVPRLTGARVLLDLQECMPEFFATKFGVGLDHPVVRLIARVEQASIRFAHLVVTPTRQMRDAFVGRGASPQRILVVMDGADNVLEIQVKKTGADSNWIWGAFKMPGATLRALHELWCERGRGDVYMGTLVNAWLARGGRARAVRAGTAYVDVGTLHGYREAITLLGRGAQRASSESSDERARRGSASGR